MSCLGYGCCISFSYFSYKISFGVLMQCGASIGHIIDSLSYFINSFNDINRLISGHRRLKEINFLNYNFVPYSLRIIIERGVLLVVKQRYFFYFY